MSARRLLQLQAASGLTFLLFAAVHLANTAAAVGGPETYNGLQHSLRAVYQFPGVELLLIFLPLSIHVAAAIVRFRRSGFRRPHQGWRTRLHRYTGYYLLVFIAGHTLATRGASVVYGVYPEFEGLSFTLWWIPAFFYPYYITLALSGLYHGANGLLIALSTFFRPVPDRIRQGWRFWVPVGFAGVALVLGLFALGGQLFEIQNPTDSEYARLWEREFGVDLDR